MSLYAQKPMLTDSWPTYNGDFSGRRFSPLAKINDRNVNQLTLANPRGTPLMSDVVIYFSSTDNAFAIDAPAI
jgi:alcohol dehydrogenase (cytochrome c)